MKKAIVFLANGFEEMEATGTVDILRRGGIDTKTVSITDDRSIQLEQFGTGERSLITTIP